jgi:hypothetical protein
LAHEELVQGLEINVSAGAETSIDATLRGGRRADHKHRCQGAGRNAGNPEISTCCRKVPALRDGACLTLPYINV